MSKVYYSDELLRDWLENLTSKDAERLITMLENFLADGGDLKLHWQTKSGER